MPNTTTANVSDTDRPVTGSEVVYPVADTSRHRHRLRITKGVPNNAAWAVLARNLRTSSRDSSCGERCVFQRAQPKMRTKICNYYKEILPKRSEHIVSKTFDTFWFMGRICRGASLQGKGESFGRGGGEGGYL